MAAQTGGEQQQDYLRELAQTVISEISELDPDHCKELLGTFVSELFFSLSEQQRKDQQRQRQAEGIAAAKKKGVRLGRPPAPLPDNFRQICQDWQDKKLTLQQAADACNMPSTTFYTKAMKVKG